MQLDYFSKWKELDSKLVGRLIDEKISIYLPNSSPNLIFISNSGNYDRSFCIEFDAQLLNGYNPKKINGLDIKVRTNNSLNPQKLYLEVNNVSKENDNAFIAFSVVVFDAIENALTSEETLSTFESTIEAYQDFFCYKKELSKEEEQGIVAELLFLEEIIKKNGDSAITCWFGCEKNKRDFIFGDYGVEIKSTKNQEQDIIHISNENQLDVGTLSQLFLRLYVFDENPTGYTISSCIKKILSLIVTAEGKKIFLSKLMLHKIDPLSYEGKYYFAIEKIKTYKVDESFPKLTKDNIPECVYDVKYRLNLSGISSISEAIFND